MKKILTICAFLSLLSFNILAQDVTVSLPVVEGDTGQEMLLPILVSTPLNIVGAVSLKIKIDQNVAKYVGIENNNISGSFFTAVLRDDGVLLISWFDLTPKSITNKILDIKVLYKSGSTELSFVETNKISNGDGLPYNATFVDGEIEVSTGPKFTDVMPDTTVNAEETLTYQYVGEQPEDKDIEFALEVGPSSATVSTDGLFSWVTSYEDSDVNEIVVSLTSDGITVYDTSNVTVIKTNRAPYFTDTMPADTTIEVGSWPVYISFLYKGEDPDGDVVTYSLVDAPGDAAILESGTFTFTPEPLDNIGKYDYTIKVEISDGELIAEAITVITLDVITDVTTEELLPEKYSLDQNYPNPFNPTSTIRFALPKQSDVNLAVYNMLGQYVTTLVETQLSAGVHTVQFNAFELSSGIYLYKLTATAIDGAKVFNSIKKMMLMK